MGLTRPSRMLRLMHMLESAWNITEPVQAMVHVEHADRARLHEDHGEMLDAFVDRDVDRLLAAAPLTTAGSTKVVATLPADSGLSAPEDIADENILSGNRRKYRRGKHFLASQHVADWKLQHDRYPENHRHGADRRRRHRRGRRASRRRRRHQARLRPPAHQRGPRAAAASRPGARTTSSRSGCPTCTASAATSPRAACSPSA